MGGNDPKWGKREEVGKINEKSGKRGKIVRNWGKRGKIEGEKWNKMGKLI